MKILPSVCARIRITFVRRLKDNCIIVVNVLLPLLACLDVEVVSADNCSQTLTVCICAETESGLLNVTCTNTVDPKALTNDMKALTGKTIEALYLDNLQFWPWPNGLFVGLKVQFLYLKNCIIPKLISPNKRLILEGLEDSLTFLELTNLNSRVLKWSRLRNMVSLKMLKVINTPTEKLYKSISTVSGGNLTSVSFIGNKMEVINKRALQNLTHVVEIIIEKNLLSEIDRSMFPVPANELLIFSLESNRISQIPADFFTDMPKLQFLSIKGNLLQVISDDIMKPIFSGLELLLMSENPLTCDCKLQWLFQSMENFKGGADFVNATCAAPTKLVNQTLTALSVETLTC